MRKNEVGSWQLAVGKHQPKAQNPKPKTRMKQLIFICLLFLAACSNTRYLEDHEYLYTGAKLKIETSKEIVDKSDIKGELEEVIYPAPNKSFLGFRSKLRIYNLIGGQKDDNDEFINEKVVHKWIREHFGEPPVRLVNLNPQQVRRLMLNRLENRGHFYSSVTYEEKYARWNKQKVKIIYTAHLSPAYTIDKLYFPNKINENDTLIKNAKSGSLLRKGDTYNLQTMIDERERIDRSLKDGGYYFFSPDFLIFKVDSTIGERKLEIRLDLKKDIPAKAITPQRINNIYIYPDHSLDGKTNKEIGDTLIIDNLHYIRQDELFKPEIIANSIFFKRGEFYSYHDHNMTLKYLMALGVFKFANVHFQQVDSVGLNMLDTYVYLTPLNKRYLRFELNTVTKSIGFAGPGFVASTNNRNLFGGAEQLTVQIDGGIEKQLTGKKQENLGDFSYEFGIKTELIVPRFVPFQYEKQSRRYVPKTKFAIEYRQMHSTRYYNMNTFGITFGYKWKETQNKKHELYPASISYQRIGETTPAFDSIISNNSLLARSFEQQFILGLEYSYTITTKNPNRKMGRIYFNVNTNLSGNIMYAINSTFDKSETSGDEPYRFLRNIYSQFIKTGIDFRYYYKFNKRNRFASRLLAGIGVPWGNSDVLPYLKQYFIGGTNSIRAFRARSFGPGSYSLPTDSAILIDQTGDIKLEANVEYRFNITPSIEGAVFCDLGNVWLLDEDDERPGGKFDLDKFQEEIALGAGFGFRYVTDYFIVRVDVAFPLRKPYGIENKRWIHNDDKSFRDEWMPTYNIAIGYPF